MAFPILSLYSLGPFGNLLGIVYPINAFTVNPKIQAFGFL